MAGTRDPNQFLELVSPFLREKLEFLKNEFGANSSEYLGIARQYIKNEQEEIRSLIERPRHYNSEVKIKFNNKDVKGVERLYKKTVLIEPTTVCAAHCRWCLRGLYPIQTLSAEEITTACMYIGEGDLGKEVDEVLITGGDPLISPVHIGLVLASLKQYAQNIKIVRIGTRMPFHDPKRISSNLLETFERYLDTFRFEIGFNINHPVEFWPESIEALKKLKKLGVTFYNQNPLLKGVNDNLATLAELYLKLREQNIEAHYLFHAIPMRGTAHHRTSLRKGLDLITKLSSSGKFSGRSKPKYAILSDIGKIVIYEGALLKYEADTNEILVQSGFNIKDRLKWNPSWEVPASVEIDKNGIMSTWYLDGKDE